MTSSASFIRLGAISFLNTRPLLAGLESDPSVRFHMAVPSRLPAALAAGQVDAALVPAIEIARAGRAWRVVSDACIAADGETLTVRVFSRVCPQDIRVLHTDTDSRTSVALARLIWRRRFGRAVEFPPLKRVGDWGECEAVLLIGDKVVTAAPRDFDHQVDLGAAWKEWTGLPFVFAAWAARPDADPRLAGLLAAARDQGVAEAARLAREDGPRHGWPVELAEVYLTRYMKYTLTLEARRGMELFFDMADREGLLAPSGPVAVR